MKTLKQSLSIICLLTLMLSIMPASYAAGYKVKHWTNEQDSYDDTNYFTVYQGTLDPMYAPTFYSNIYTGWDVEISFYRQYDSASIEQAEALCEYLTSHAESKYNCASYYYYMEDGLITDIYVWFMDGWDVNDPELDFQDLWDREVWMNAYATGLILEYLGYGRGEETWEYAQERGCSNIVTAQASEEQYGFPGVTFGFHFIEGVDSHAVWRYCPNETW